MIIHSSPRILLRFEDLIASDPRMNSGATSQQADDCSPARTSNWECRGQSEIHLEFEIWLG